MNASERIRAAREAREYLVGHYMRHGWTNAQAERAANRPGLNLDRAVKLAQRVGHV